VPRSLNDIISYFTAMMYKHYYAPTFVESICSALKMVILDNRLHFLSLEGNHFLNCLLLTL